MTDLGAPDLTDTIWLDGGSKSEIVAQIHDPQHGDMPRGRGGWTRRPSRASRTMFTRLAAASRLGGGREDRVFVAAPPEAIDDEVETTAMTLRDQATGAEATNATVFQGPG